MACPLMEITKERRPFWRHIMKCWTLKCLGRSLLWEVEKPAVKFALVWHLQDEGGILVYLDFRGRVQIPL